MPTIVLFCRLFLLLVLAAFVPLCVLQEGLAANLGAPIRLGKGAVGHGDRAVEFSPDGQILAVATAIGAVLRCKNNPPNWAAGREHRWRGS